MKRFELTQSEKEFTKAMRDKYGMSVGRLFDNADKLTESERATLEQIGSDVAKRDADWNRLFDSICDSVVHGPDWDERVLSLATEKGMDPIDVKKALMGDPTL